MPSSPSLVLYLQVCIKVTIEYKPKVAVADIDQRTSLVNLSIDYSGENIYSESPWSFQDGG